LTLSIQAAHYSPQTLSFTVEDSMTNFPITLTRGHILRGRVIDSDGGGVADAEVEAVRLDRPKEFEWRARTDADGRFNWDGAPQDPATYVVHKTGFLGKQAVLAANESEQTVALERIGE